MEVHNYDKRLKKAIENVSQCDFISPGNRELMLKFIEYKRAQARAGVRGQHFLPNHNTYH